MAASNPNIEVEDLHSILDHVVNNLTGLPAGQKDEIAKDLHRLQSRINDLLADKARCSRTAAELILSNQALAAREQQYREIVESIQDGLIVINQNWQITYINHRAAQNGCEPEELIGQILWKVFPHLQGTIAEETYHRVMAEKIPAQFEMEDVYPGFWYSVSVYPTATGITVFWQDITARKQAELNTLERQKRLEQLDDLLNSAQEPIFVLDNNWDYIFANRNHHKNLGVEPGSLIGKNFWEANPRAFGTPVEYHLRKARKEGRPSHGRFVGLYVPVWYDFLAYPTAEGVTVFSYDRTEEVKAEQALQESEVRIRQILDSISDSFFELDQNYVFTYMNNPGASRLGLRPEDVIGKNIWELYPSLLGSEQERLFRQAMENRQPVQFEAQGKITPYWYEYRIYPSRAGITVYSTDITDRKRAEKELQQSEERFARAFRSNPAGLTISRLADGRFIDANDSFLQMTGYTREEVIGRTAIELGFIPSFETQTEIFQLLKKNGQVREFEATLSIKSGQILQGLYSMVVVEISGEACLLSTFLNLTEMRRLEEQAIEAKTNLEVQHRLVEQREQERQMIARDIHDGPIQSLVSTIFNIQMTKEALPDPQMQVELNQIGLSIKNTIQELRHVVNELRPPAVLHVGLSRMIRMHCADFMEKHPEIQVDHELADDRGKLLENTCLTLYRIYQEAMNNIARHANATHVNVRFSFKDDQAVLEITDNGKGLASAPDLISQTAKGHYGMAGMKERAEAANGKFQIQSTPGTGTTIWLMVPIETESEE